MNNDNNSEEAGWRDYLWVGMSVCIVSLPGILAWIAVVGAGFAGYWLFDFIFNELTK